MHDEENPDDDAMSAEIAAAAAAANEAIRRVLAPFESQAEILRQAIAPVTTALARALLRPGMGAAVAMLDA